MELKEFVAGTLIEIARGIEQADKQLKDSHAIVNPRNVLLHYPSTSSSYETIEENIKEPKDRKVQQIEFDVAVTVADSKETKGAIGIVVGSIGLGSQGKSESGSSATSRIKFSVPMVLPNGMMK